MPQSVSLFASPESVSAPSPPHNVLALASPVSVSSQPEPPRFSIPVNVSPWASPPDPWPVLRLTSTPSALPIYAAVAERRPATSTSAPSPPTSRSAPSMPQSVSLSAQYGTRSSPESDSMSLPSPPHNVLVPASPVSVSFHPEPPRFWMRCNLSPSASPPDAWPVPRLTMTPSGLPIYAAVSLPVPPSSISAPAPPISTSSSSIPYSALLLASPVSTSP